MAVVLTYAAQVRYSRSDGSPGSTPTPEPRHVGRETTLPAYRGDAVNALPFEADAPRSSIALIEVYEHALRRRR